MRIAAVVQDLCGTGHLVTVHHRNFKRNDGRTELAAQIIDCLFEVCVIIIDLVDEENDRQIVLFAQFYGAFRSGFDAFLSGYDYDSQVSDSCTGNFLTDIVQISRSIEKVDLCVLPLDRSDSRKYRQTSLRFFRIIVHR